MKNTGFHKQFPVDKALSNFIGKDTCSRPEVERCIGLSLYVVHETYLGLYQEERMCE